MTNCHALKLKAKDGKYRLTDVWKDNGVTEEIEYVILTNEIYKEWSRFTAKVLDDLKKSDFQKCSALFDEINNAMKKV